TVDLPDPMPPVSPTITMGANVAGAGIMRHPPRSALLTAAGRASCRSTCRRPTRAAAIDAAGPRLAAQLPRCHQRVALARHGPSAGLARSAARARGPSADLGRAASDVLLSGPARILGRVAAVVG